MKKIVIFAKIILCVGIFLIGTGLIITKGDLTIITNDERNINFIDEENEITTLDIDISSDNIEFLISEDNKLHIEYYTCKRSPYNYSYENGKAKFFCKKNNIFVNVFNFGNNKQVKIFLPNTEIEQIFINCSSGNISNKDCIINVNNLNVSVSSGNIDLKNVTAEKSTLLTSSGNINLNNCSINEININVSSGNISLIDSTLTTLNIKKSSGDLSSKNLISNFIECNTSSGNTILSLKGEIVDYSINVKDLSGNIMLISESKSINMKTKNNLNYGTGTNIIICNSSSGDVKIIFE